MNGPLHSPIDAYRAELLAISEATDYDGPVLIMTIRPDNRLFCSYNLAFTKPQALRMLGHLTQLLTDPDSWLYGSDVSQ
jgi:hypothetical protein